MIKGQSFIVFSDDWGQHPSSCQHIFKRISLNNRILWINTIGMRVPGFCRQDIKRIIEKILGWIRCRERQDGNLVVFSPRMLPAFKPKFFRKINSILLSRGIKKVRRKHKINNPILVTTLPIVADLIGKLGEIKSVYYCVDEFSQWPRMMKKTMAEMEKTLIDKVDLILAASDKLYQSRRNSQCPTYLFSHGVDFQHFMKANLEGTEVPADITSIKRPIIGLYGSFDERTDFNIIRHISITHSDWSIVLVGRLLTKLRGFSRFKNVFFLGPRPYELLPNYLKSFDVCIIPYIVSDGSIFYSGPVKLREYLAAGKPIVSTPIPEVEKFNGILKITNDKDGFVKFIELSLKENNKDKIKMRQVAVRNDTWDAKVEEFSRHIEEMLFKPRTNKSRESKVIRVMHLSSAVGAGGGPDKTILLSAEKINKEIFYPVVVYLINKDDQKFNSTIANKAQQKNLNFYAISENYKIEWQSIKKLKNLIKGHQIDILHSHGYKADCLGLLLSKWHKVKLVATTHGWFGNDPKERFHNWLDKKAIRYYDKVIAVSEAMRRYLLGIGIPSQKLITIHNAIDAENFKKNGLCDIRQELNLDRQIPIVGVIGRLSKEKDLETLFLAAKEVLSRKREVRFLIVGEGPERKNLEGLADKLKIKGNIIFLGQREDIKRIYVTINLLVSISTTEGLPNTILEALSMEVPVVATEVGGVGEIISNNVNGLLFQPGDVTGIAGGINCLLSDSVLVSSFIREGRKLVCEKFSFAERMRKMEKLYLEVMG